MKKEKRAARHARNKRHAHAHVQGGRKLYINTEGVVDVLRDRGGGKESV